MTQSSVAPRVGIQPLLSIVALALVSSFAVSDASAAQGIVVGGREFPSMHLAAPASGAAIPGALGARLPEVAGFYGMTAEQLEGLAKSDRSLRVDATGRLAYSCDGLVAKSPPADAGAVVEAAPFALAQTFQLHSRQYANRTIYLDFDGNVTTGTYWNSTFTVITTPSFDIDADPSSFSDAELAAIQEIWQRVAEDYAPYDIDVTTADPGIEALRKTSSTDQIYGQHVCIGGSCWDWYGNSAGGVSYVGCFNWASDTPNFVFPMELGNGYPKYVAEAVSHEVGHSLGLSHDGTTTGVSYYEGQGDWAPIMGVGYYRSTVQWSKGEYANANNQQDDLAVMQNYGAVYRADDHGDTPATATVLPMEMALSASGAIEHTGDIDAFQFKSGPGAISFTVALSDPSPNLNVRARIFDGAGNLVAYADSTTLGATLTPTVPYGTYYLLVDGVGAGDPLTTGYSDYASLGQYTVTGSVQNPNLFPPTPWATATPTSGLPPLDVAFSGDGSSDEDGWIVAYDWDFGDGSPHSSEPNPAHRFDSPGKYFCKLTVTDNDGLTGSMSLVITAAGPPAAPTNLVAAPACSGTDLSHGVIALNWQDNSSNEDRFEVERSTDGVTFFPLAIQPTLIVNFYTNIGLPLGTLEYYRVRAVNGDGASSYSNVASATTSSLPAVAPVLTATVTGGATIALAWNTVANATAYQVQRSPDGVTVWSQVSELAPDVTTFGDSGLKPLTAYYYRIRSVGACGYGTAFSAVVKATTLAAPAMPSSVSLKALTWTKVKVTWRDNSTNETGFEIQRSTSLTFNPNADYIVSANTIAFLDSTVSAKQLYYYRVRSFANGANSLWTRTSSLTTPADSTKLLPLAPSNASATALAGPVNKLTWKDNSAYELGFKIQRSTTSSFTTPDSFVVGQNTITYRDSIGLVKGIKYYYRVRSFNAIGNSSWSSSFSVTTSTLAAGIVADASPTPAPPAPTGSPDAAPTAIRLGIAAPNPFAQRATIAFELPAATAVDLGIFDLGGRRVATLASGMWGAGRHQAQWDGRDDHGNNQASGVFFARFSAGRHLETRKLILAR